LQIFNYIWYLEWIVVAINGYFVHRRFSLHGFQFTISLLARKSRHFAGTRFLKRGVSDRGWCANDVETELSLWANPNLFNSSTAAGARFASFVQVRGSPPVCWSQDPDAVLPKPPILYPRSDCLYDSTHAHFADLQARFVLFCDGIFILIIWIVLSVEFSF
jgi:hypothetical protein